MRHKTGSGVKKSLEFELNLTPFIDLLSTCVCFLLITAVWIEVGTVEVKQSHGTDAAPEKKESFDLDLVFLSPSHLSLNLKKGGKSVQKVDVQSDTYEGMISQLGADIPSKILSYKNMPVEIAAATVTPRSTVDYGNLIGTLDVLRKNKIVNIGILTARGN